MKLVQNQTSLGVFNRLFLVPKPNNKWRPISDLSKLNLFLKTIRGVGHLNRFQRRLLSYPHSRTIQEIQDQTYQFKALPFSLSTAPLEFTVVVKEVKLMAIRKGIRIHQYLDDWLVRARSHQTCLQHTQDRVIICQKLGWLVNLDKSELEPKQIFDFIALIHLA